MDENKNIDETWKEKVEKEKDSPTQGQDRETYQKPDFNFFITTLSMQAMIALGRLENPLSGKKEKNANQARFIIDTLDMIKEKTTGNLSGEEKGFLENLLSDLKLCYVEEAK